MSLTLGNVAPLGRPTGGRLNFDLPDKPAHFLYIHELHRRIRGVVDATPVVDTENAVLLHETGLLPRWYFPRDGVATELLVPSDTTTHCPFKGNARYWHLRVGDRVIEDAFWEYAEPLPGAEPIRGMLSPYAEKLDRWFEEDDELLEGHLRDPFHRVDARPSSRKVVVSVAGVMVASTDRPVAVFETGLPTVWYVPLADVRENLLVPSQKTTICPYKGVASYWSLRLEDDVLQNAVWTYEEPLPEALPVKGYAGFAGEDIQVDVGPAS